ncbi:hypothetical protein I4P08_10790 [Enterobacter hormaechei]|uniref:hypothetical protein n=1 Tax=Enterobacter hormaechei TaxID=158836 RepID=UPI0007937297|nr:hypothetical protein [Enterobacter hormaechei]MCU2458400.1 hypothetical protein [Enterobacter hormaechei subsp. hoffmannii]MBG0686687.1 hypothetical protein [Enterobacter hormaechei]MCU3422531.1 hypothetical protein [Enterobacter hormaechei subsp. hoffmannii]MCU3777019.1 hypothetical protein [Enterobacter hormaechei subsp. hoffmannii]SAH71903.1 Phage EaD protein [Enterobacter hormaechei]
MEPSYEELEQKLIESERYGRQTDITIDNLEMKLAQMAAELASVKQQEPKAWFIRITDEVTVDAREGEKWRGVPLVRVDVETPNHDAFLAEARAQGVKSLSNAVQSVISERQRQQSVEGWTLEHDDQYSKSQLLWASSCYVLNTIQPFNRIPLDWPWAPEWWKPTNPRRDLVKAGALILAEIERIDRQEAAQ